MRTKHFVLTLSVLLFSLALPSATHAIGATHCGARYVPYVPYETVSFSHAVINAPGGYTVALTGEWNGSMKIDSQTGNVVSGTLTMPPDWSKPGVVQNYVVFTEIPPASRTGTAVAVTRVRCPIYVRVPYPGKYLEFDFTTKNINEGQTAVANYFIGSRGKDPVDGAKLTFTIEKNGTVYSTYSETLNRILPQAEIRRPVNLTTASLSPGVYTVRGTLSYSHENVTVMRELHVGKLDVGVSKYSKTLPVGDFSKINFTIQSDWNNPIKEVYLTYTISNQQQSFPTVKTETFSLGPFQNETITSIAETPSVLPGTSFVKYMVHFDGNERSGVLPITFVRSGPNLKLILFALLGLLVTIMIVLALVILRRNGTAGSAKKRPKRGKRR